MRLVRFRCHDFRCLLDVDFEPSPGINVIRGKNGQGKTSILEAIHYAATSKSHRTNADAELARYGSDGFDIQLDVQRIDRTATVEARWWQAAKRFKVNGVPQTRLSDILGRVNVVLFSPEDIALVKDSASVRRRFLDMELSQLSPPYLAALQEYRGVLKQRNSLLKAAPIDEGQLDVWDAQLVRYGSELIELRNGYLFELADCAAGVYARIAEGEALGIQYSPDVNAKGDLADVLKRARTSDIRNGATGRGPHRDDFEILVKAHPARNHGSQGQQKTAALALKLATLEVVARRNGEYPILMLDEVLAELDAERARRLFEAIGPEVQCLLTTTDLRLDAAGLRERTDFTIDEGRICAA